MAAPKALRHNWLRNNRDQKTANLFDVAQTNVSRYNAMKRWKAAIHLVQAVNRMKASIVASPPPSGRFTSALPPASAAGVVAWGGPPGGGAAANGSAGRQPAIAGDGYGLPLTLAPPPPSPLTHRRSLDSVGNPSRRSTPPSQPPSQPASLRVHDFGASGGALKPSASPASHAYIDAMSGAADSSLGGVSGWRESTGVGSRRAGGGGGSAASTAGGSARAAGLGRGGPGGGQVATLDTATLTSAADAVVGSRGGGRGLTQFLSRCFGNRLAGGGRSSTTPSGGSSK